MKVKGDSYFKIGLFITNFVKHELRRPQTNGKVEYSQRFPDKEFYKKGKFSSFKDRFEKLKEFTDYLNYIKPNMAIGGLTPYEKLLKIKNEEDLTRNPNYTIIKAMQQREVIDKKLVA